MFFKQPIIRSEAHLRFIASLPCLVTGKEDGTVVAHHLLKDTGGQRGKGLKPGDNWTIPVCHEIHDAIHRHGSEYLFFSKDGIGSAANAAGMLYEYTQDHDQALDFIHRIFSQDWGKRTALKLLDTTRR